MSGKNDWSSTNYESRFSHWQRPILRFRPVCLPAALADLAGLLPSPRN